MGINDHPTLYQYGMLYYFYNPLDDLPNKLISYNFGLPVKFNNESYMALCLHNFLDTFTIGYFQYFSQLSVITISTLY